MPLALAWSLFPTRLSLVILPHPPCLPSFCCFLPPSVNVQGLVVTEFYERLGHFRDVACSSAWVTQAAHSNLVEMPRHRPVIRLEGAPSDVEEEEDDDEDEGDGEEEEEEEGAKPRDKRRRSGLSDRHSSGKRTRSGSAMGSLRGKGMQGGA